MSIKCRCYVFILIASVMTLLNVKGHSACREFTKAVAAINSSLFLQDDGTVWAAGSNSSGELGVGGSTSFRTNYMVQVSDLAHVVDIAAGGSHCLAVLDDGTVWAWGANSSGELGDGTQNGSNVPVQVNLPPTVRAVAVTAGTSFSVALMDDGAVWTWGRNTVGQLGTGSFASTVTPVKIPSFEAKAIDAGAEFCLAIRKSDNVVCAWGRNNVGQLGDGTILTRTSPTPTFGSFTALGISAGQAFSLAIRLADNVVFGWGDNQDGQLGDNTIVNKSVPTSTFGALKAKQVAAGSSSSFAIALATNTVYSWGNGVNGVLGSGVLDDNLVPAQIYISDLSVASSINASNVVFAIRSTDNSVWGWGSGSSGQLANGYNVQSYIPTKAILGPVITQAIGSTTVPSESMVSIDFESNLMGASYSWTVEQNGVIGAEDGSGQSIEQTLIATQTVPGTVIYTITPTIDGCEGFPFVLQITVLPIPVAEVEPSSLAICSGSLTEIELFSDVTNASFSWTYASKNVSGATNGSGNMIQESLLLTNDEPGQVIYTVTPQKDGVAGDPITIHVQVNLCAPVAPSHFCGKRKLKDGAHYVSLTWKPSFDPRVVSYYVYSNHNLIDIVPATGPYTVRVPYCKKNDTIYRLVAVDENGVKSKVLTLKLGSAEKKRKL